MVAIRGVRGGLMRSERRNLMRTGRRAVPIACALAALGSGLAAPAWGQQPATAPPAAPAAGALTGAVGETQTGLAAYYSTRLNGSRTASGERYRQDALTTAHQTLPFGTRVKVTNAKNNRSVLLRVNDRGPTQPGRILDVSRRAAQSLGFVRAGLVETKLEVVEAAKPRGRKS
jgi:rare lipoprotein A